MYRRIIQKEVLPDGWQNSVLIFDIQSSNLSTNNKKIVQAIQEKAQNDLEGSLQNSLFKSLVLRIIFKKPFLKGYKDLPMELIAEGLKELKGEKEFNYTRRLHSIFIEFQVYQDLTFRGYRYCSFNRTEGSCDLKMAKGNQLYHFEIKFKEKDDIFVSRLFDIIDSKSLLHEHSFLRGKTFEIQLKTIAPNDADQKKIIYEVESFVKEKSDIFKGDFIEIFNPKKKEKKSRDINSVSANLERCKIEEIKNLDDIENLIKKIHD